MATTKEPKIPYNVLPSDCDIQPKVDPDFTGKWELQRLHNFEQYLEAEGYSWISRKALAKLGETEYIYHDIDNERFMSKSKVTTGQKQHLCVSLNGETVQYTNIEGQTVRSEFTWNNDKSVLIEKMIKIIDDENTKKCTKYRLIDKHGQFVIIRQNESGVTCDVVYSRKHIVKSVLYGMFSLHLHENPNQKRAEAKIDDVGVLQAKVQRLSEMNRSLEAEIAKLTQANVEKEEKKDEMYGIYQVRFQQWLCETVGLERYLTAFQEQQCDDIRMMEFLDEDVLRKEIGIGLTMHCKLILKKAREWQAEHAEFKAFLEKQPTLKEWRRELEKHGIFTMWQMKQEIDAKAKLAQILQGANDEQLRCLWEIIQGKVGGEVEGSGNANR